MTFDLTTMPTNIDLLHLLLGAAALLLLLLYLSRAGHRAAPPAVHEPTPSPAAGSTAPQLKSTAPDSALQLLSLLQQEARLVDFLREDLSGFSDEEIGAAARVVHGGGRKVLTDYFTLSQIRDEAEQSRVQLPAGFDAAETRVTGNVVGEPPFTGTLIHRGWRVEGVKLPQLAAGHDPTILMPAEVEL